MTSNIKEDIVCNKINIKNKLYLQNINLTNDILQLPITNKDVDTLKDQQFFKKNIDGDIYTLKNIIVGNDKNIGTTNIYSKSISINRVSKSITQYYNSIINVNTIINFIFNNIELIKQYGFDKVLRPFVEKTYYENENYFWINSCPNSDNPNLINNNKTLFSWKIYEKYMGTTI